MEIAPKAASEPCHRPSFLLSYSGPLVMILTVSTSSIALQLFFLGKFGGLFCLANGCVMLREIHGSEDTWKEKSGPVMLF